MRSPLTLSIDPLTRFPLIEVPGQNYALFWLPITKIQLEYFLSETIDSHFDQKWYDERLRNSPRGIPEKLTTFNFLHAFITNITFDDARVFCRWFGEGFDLPTSREWHSARQAFDQFVAHPAIVDEILQLEDLHPRAQLLVRHCENAAPSYPHLRDPSQRRLSHQLLLRSGMLEYVYQNDPSYNLCGACGSSYQSGKSGNTSQDDFIPLRHADIGERMPNLGLRPILRKFG